MNGVVARLAERGIEREHPSYSVRVGGSLVSLVRDPIPDAGWCRVSDPLTKR
jgi:hypothetical protein